jgi:hypothetical protein
MIVVQRDWSLDCEAVSRIRNDVESHGPSDWDPFPEEFLRFAEHVFGEGHNHVVLLMEITPAAARGTYRKNEERLSVETQVFTGNS